jgi:peptidoglycan hydrolase-like protein with peptidoglycan-binding domain
MFLLHHHEHSPRVTLLQVLLKDEHKIQVDGIFGPKTFAALKAFQSSRGQFPSGQATPDTWRELLLGTNLAVISSVDMGDEGLKVDVQALKASGDNPIELGAMCNGLGQLISDVEGRASGKSIAALRLDGHGNLGRWMTVSVGDVVDMTKKDYKETAKEYYSYIDAGHFSKVSGLLGKLSGRFAPFGFAEHHGCSLGKRPETRRMMARLADLWRVPVSVGIVLQPFGAVTYFQGPVVTVFPLGMNLHSWSQQFQNVSVRIMTPMRRSASSFR